MAGHPVSARAAARRRALAVKARRQAAAAKREEKICELLARYFEATGRAEQYQAEAAGAVRDLQAVAGTSADVADLCGISISAVRALTATAQAAADDRPGEQDGPGQQPQ
jgi:hypothetical protein